MQIWYLIQRHSGSRSKHRHKCLTDIIKTNPVNYATGTLSLNRILIILTNSRNLYYRHTLPTNQLYCIIFPTFCSDWKGNPWTITMGLRIVLFLLFLVSTVLFVWVSKVKNIVSVHGKSGDPLNPRNVQQYNTSFRLNDQEGDIMSFVQVDTVHLVSVC